MTDKLRDAAPLLPCPFCGDDGDKGTQAVTLMNAERTSFRRVSCRCCGATCPEPNWNHRAARAQQDAQAVPPSDTDLRRLWAAHAAKMHGWASNAIPAMHDTGNGPRFECSWHEQEFGVFKAGYLAASQSAPTPPAQRVMLTPDEIDEVWNSIAGHSIYAEYQIEIASAMIEAYERKNRIK